MGRCGGLTMFGGQAGFPAAVGMFLSMLAPLAAADLTVEVIGRTENSYTLMLTHESPLEIWQAQQALLPTARELCGEDSPTYGKYNFSSRERVGRNDPSEKEGESFVFVQKIVCGAGHGAGAERPKASLSERERRKVGESARELSRFYLDSLGKGEYRVAYAMLSEDLQAMVPYEAWRGGKQGFRIMAGAMLEQDVWNITVYDNPPSAPTPGVYVAADYEISYENVLFQCGALVWIRQPDGFYRIINAEEGYLDKSMAKDLTQAEIQEVRKKMLRCRPSRGHASDREPVPSR